MRAKPRGPGSDRGVSPLRRRLFYGILLIALTGARGHILAHTIGGRYRWQDWCLDSLAFAILLMGVKLLDAGAQKVLQKALPDNRAGRTVILALRLALLFVGLFPFLLATLQIHPQRISTKGTPSDWDVPYEEVTLRSQGRTLHGWYCPQPTPQSAIFVAHGLNANRENFLQPVRLLHDLGHAVLIIDFPAHGDSQGRSTTLGYREAADVQAAHDWLAERNPTLPIHALGYSMGASAILTAASNHGSFERIAVDGTFTSIRQVAQSTVLRFTGPLEDMIWTLGAFWINAWTGADLNRHRPIDALANIAPSKLLIIHGTADRVIPYGEGLSLHQATGEQAQFISVDGYGHAETIAHPDYITWLDDFFKP